MLYDTEFIIRLAGQGGGKAKVATEAFLAGQGDAQSYISRVSWSEFAEGCEHEAMADRETRRFRVLEITPRIAWIASRVSRNLERKGEHIGDNDIWIAATAIAYGMPLVSNNARHLGRVPGLDLRAY